MFLQSTLHGNSISDFFWWIKIPKTLAVLATQFITFPLSLVFDIRNSADRSIPCRATRPLSITM